MTSPSFPCLPVFARRLVGHHRPRRQAEDVGRVVPLLRQGRCHVSLGRGPGALSAADEVGLVDDALGLETRHGVPRRGRAVVLAG